MITCINKIIKNNVIVQGKKAKFIVNECRQESTKVSVLTTADLGADSLGERDALRQLVSEALAHVVVNVIGPQELLKDLGGVP